MSGDPHRLATAEHPGTWSPIRVSFGKLLARRLGGGAELEGTIDRMIEEDYEKNL